jgi:hypothetical protein
VLDDRSGIVNSGLELGMALKESVRFFCLSSLQTRFTSIFCLLARLGEMKVFIPTRRRIQERFFCDNEGRLGVYMNPNYIKGDATDQMLKLAHDNASFCK